MKVQNTTLLQDIGLFILLIILKVQSARGINFEAGPLKQVDVGLKLIKALITRETDVDLFTCVDSCLKRKRCKSVNYLEVFKICELNYKRREEVDVIEQMINDPSSLYLDEDHLNKYKLRTECEQNPCGENQKCMEKVGGGIRCITSDCGQPTHQNNATYNADNGIGLYSKVTYLCNEGYYMQGKSYVGCQGDGTWSHVRFKCLSVCENEWNYFQNSCYRLFRTNVTWWIGKEICKQQGGYLAEIESAAENEFIHTLEPGYYRAWIGGTDHQVEGDWTWDNSGKIIPYPNTTTHIYDYWGDGEPNNGISGNEDCMAMHDKNNGIWIDVFCNDQNKYICEKGPITL